MTSKERHAIRYQRRVRRRQEKNHFKNITFDDVFSLENLYRAGKRCCNGSRWKSSTINFETRLFKEALDVYESLHNGKRKFPGFNSFTTIEHGKLRYIDALPIRERMIQKCFCENLLTEGFARRFIYDNSASLSGKGMDFALKRLKKHLRQHFRKHGLEGGIYMFDFHSYFASLSHAVIKERAKAVIGDERLYNLFCSLVDDFGRMKKHNHERGVGLGSEISQIIALDYASPIDHYIKDKCRKSYGRYMDDGYVISDSLSELKQLKEDVYALAKRLGLTMNDKKNTIIPFRHHSFTFLKMRFKIKETGRIIVKLSRKSIKAIRRKLYIFRRWADTSRLNPKDALSSYQSWRLYAMRADSHRTLRNMDRRFKYLFRQRRDLDEVYCT